MKPETPLPWTNLPLIPGWTDQEDIDFILHACNAYPKLVRALKQATLDGYGQCLPFNRPHVELLKELGEL